MKKGGKGGGRTVTGARFEGKSILQAAIKDIPDYEVRKAKVGFDVLYRGKVVACSYRQRTLYKFLESKGVDYKKYISKRLFPDDAIIVFSQRRANIIEVKYQETEGSVDEKLQTADFKKKQYEKLFNALDLEVHFIYVLNSWFQNPKYKDTLNYIQSVGCEYYIEELPLEALGLPGSEDIDIAQEVSK